MSPRGVPWVRAAVVLAVVLSCLGVVADLVLQYTGNAAHLYRIDALIAEVPVWRLYLGTELGLVVFVLAGAASGTSAPAWPDRLAWLASSWLPGSWPTPGARRSTQRSSTAGCSTTPRTTARR
jgi:hypothetical protein